MDVLDEILSSLRLSGGVVIDAEISGDYCVSAQFTPDHCAPWFPTPQTLISYHYVRSGRTIAEVEGSPPVALEPGSIVIMPRNEPHTLASRTGLSPADVSEISWVTTEGVHRVSSGSPGDKTKVWCGFLGASESGDHPLIAALPPLLTLKVRGQEAEWLESSLRFLSESRPSTEIVARMAELFLAQAIRATSKAAGELQGVASRLTDPAGQRCYRSSTTVMPILDAETLAREAGVSRTFLASVRRSLRIADALLREWRMRMACNMLHSWHNTANVAHGVISAARRRCRAFK